MQAVAIKYRNSDSVEKEEKEIEELETQRANLENPAEEELKPEEETFKKRYGDLRRHMQSKDTLYTEEVDKLKHQLDAVTRKQVRLPKSDEELEEWAERYPDVAKIVETIATKKALESRKDIEERLAHVDKRERQIKIDKAEQELFNMHPDYDDLRNNRDFHEWVDIQPKWIQDSLYENETDPLAASKAISLYKMETKSNSLPKDAARAVSRPRRSEEPSLERQSTWSESRVKQLRPAEYEKYEEEIMDSIRKGEFSYDLSGGAR
jgi:hypothetical protein|tara:strand:+ start:199 stop:993 length:795 start_codon:yes stop_codon:yes gene_type:complete